MRVLLVDNNFNRTGGIATCADQLHRGFLDLEAKGELTVKKVTPWFLKREETIWRVCRNNQLVSPVADYNIEVDDRKVFQDYVNDCDILIALAPYENDGVREVNIPSHVKYGTVVHAVNDFCSAVESREEIAEIASRVSPLIDERLHTICLYRSCYEPGLERLERRLGGIFTDKNISIYRMGDLGWRPWDPAQGVVKDMSAIFYGRYEDQWKRFKAVANSPEEMNKYFNKTYMLGFHLNSRKGIFSRKFMSNAEASPDWAGRLGYEKSYSRGDLERYIDKAVVGVFPSIYDDVLDSPPEWVVQEAFCLGFVPALPVEVVAKLRATLGDDFKYLKTEFDGDDIRTQKLTFKKMESYETLCEWARSNWEVYTKDYTAEESSAKLLGDMTN